MPSRSENLRAARVAASHVHDLRCGGGVEGQRRQQPQRDADGRRPEAPPRRNTPSPWLTGSSTPTRRPRSAWWAKRARGRPSSPTSSSTPTPSTGPASTPTGTSRCRRIPLSWSFRSRPGGRPSRSASSRARRPSTRPSTSSPTSTSRPTWTTWTG